MKKGLLWTVGILSVLLIVLTGGFLVYRFVNPLALQAQPYFVEKNSQFEAEQGVRYVFLPDGNEVTVSRLDQLDTSQPGTYTITYNYKDKQYPFTVEVRDTQAPVLNVRSLSTDLVQELDVWDFVESVSDSSPFTLSAKGLEESVNEPESEITIQAEDAYGNMTSKTVKLKRQKDTSAPEITNFSNTIDWKQGAAFDTDSLIVKDDLDLEPVIEVDANELDVYTPGTYQVSYQVRDRSGNEKTYEQTINVVERKIAYLTFDDGPSSENTQNVLDVLDRYGIKATFFVTGQDPASFDLITKAAQAGHTIGLHTLTHDYAYLYSSPEAYFEDLNGIKEIVKDLTGIESDVIRFPGGSSNTVSASYSTGIMSYLTQAVEEAGYQYFDWNVSSGDASGSNVPADQIVANATSFIGEPLAVFLFHDTFGKATTVEALPAIIEAYQAAGYEFEPLTKECYGAHHGVNN